jgi:glycosyltransferase involved in cell wall biosynthesis
MKIAQVAPLYESVPPKNYGGTERVVSYLTEELVRQGHEVTLFASGDSVTRAKLIAACPRSLRLHPSCVDEQAHHFVMLEQVFRDVSRFDIIHFHIDYLHFSLSKRQREPHVTTLHGRLDLPDLAPLYRHYADLPLVSISNAQRRPLPWANWQGTVYHGLPEDLFTFQPRTGKYLAFLGRIADEKGIGEAIEIAKRLDLPLRIAAKIDPRDWKYYKEEIEGQLDHPLIEFLGEIGGREKEEFLAGALAMLFPIKWPEPFGLVMIEAMACGTPVIAFPGGSVEEVMEDGITGYVVDNVDQAVAAVRRIEWLDRQRCRETFERRFSNRRMTADYLKVYQGVLEAGPRLPRKVFPPLGNGHGKVRRPRRGMARA